MRVYTCEPEWEAMLTCIYEAWTSKLGYQNIKLMIEPIDQLELFTEYIHVDINNEKAVKLMDAINIKISPFFYHEMAVTAMAYEEDMLDNIYHMLILGFAYGESVLDMLQYKDVVRNMQIRGRVRREAERFQECIRFHKVSDAYVAHIEPKSRVIEYLGPVFQDRMPSENFVIVDDIHNEAIFHKADEGYFKRKLLPDEVNKLLITEEMNDDYTDLWRIFFNTIAIKERTNPKCQLNHSPLWARKHIIEFN